jgi:hypothetical protein
MKMMTTMKKTMKRREIVSEKMGRGSWEGGR